MWLYVSRGLPVPGGQRLGDQLERPHDASTGAIAGGTKGKAHGKFSYTVDTCSVAGVSWKAAS